MAMATTANDAQTPRSEYFRAMFLTGLKEATSRRVPIHVGVRPDVFRRVVRYHYSGVVDDELDPEHVVELFVAGNEFGVDALVRPCERLIEGGLDTDNVADLWHMAATFNSTQLKQLCISFLLKQFRDQASKNVRSSHSTWLRRSVRDCSSYQRQALSLSMLSLSLS
jgi:hypothetical protein